MANRAPVSHRKQRRRPQASKGRIRITGLPSNSFGTAYVCAAMSASRPGQAAHSPRPHPQHVYRNHPSTGDTMNDPTKQDGRWGRPAYAVCVKAFQAIGRKIPRPAERTASGTWSVKTKAAKRVAANAP